MKQITALIVFAILLLVIGFFIGQSCSEKEDPNITSVLEAIEQSKEDIAEINESMKAVQDSIDALAQKRISQTNYYNYELTKMDSLFGINADSLFVNSVLRAWTNRLYKLPGFFKIAVNNRDASADSTDTSAGGDVVLPGDIIPERK